MHPLLPQRLRNLLLSALALLLVGCLTTRPHDPRYVPNFYIEALGSELKHSNVASVQLPISASVIQIKPVPSVPHFDIVSVTVNTGSMGPFLQFTLRPEARLRLMQLCGEYRGRRLVLVLGAEPLGSWRIDRILEQGTLSIHAEVDDASLPRLVQQIQATLSAHR